MYNLYGKIKDSLSIVTCRLIPLNQSLKMKQEVTARGQQALQQEATVTRPNEAKSVLHVNNTKLINAEQRQVNKAKQVISAATCVHNTHIHKGQSHITDGNRQKHIKTGCIKIDLKDKIDYIPAHVFFVCLLA